MDENQNPYAAPLAPPSTLDPPSLQQPLEARIASKWQRFGTFVIDSIVRFCIAFVAGIVIGIVAGEQGVKALEGAGGFLFGIGIALLYYIVLEGLTSRTIGKMVIGTMVVNEQGGRPSFGQILGRSFCRLIPFEPFSCFSTPCRGWHDSIPKTYVVKTR